MSDLDRFTGTLPYASELFGIYQPLLGWKSKIIASRYESNVIKAYDAVARRYLNAATSGVSVTVNADRILAVRGAMQFEVDALRPLRLPEAGRPRVAASIQSGIALLVAESVGGEPPPDWAPVLTYERATELLSDLQRIVRDPQDIARHPGMKEYVDGFVQSLGPDREAARVLTALFDKEARTAGYLVFLAEHSPSALTQLFFPNSVGAVSALTRVDPLLGFGSNGYQAILSPIGIIHLYREYFFEFDSFLGPPVGHVWLSPGGTVELVEVNTRKVFTEQTFESSLETVDRRESQLTTQDDIADAVKEDNSTDVKFGVTNTAKYSVKVFEDTATASFSLDQAKKTSRETTYKIGR